MNARETVLAYVEAVNHGPERSRQLLADDFSYQGPTFSAESADAFIEQLGSTAVDAHLRTEQLFESGSTVTHIGTLTLKHPVDATIRCCEVFEVKSGKIVRSQLFFDSRDLPQGPAS